METIRMALPEFTMRQLLEAGVHFGHQTHRWNPKMKPFIYGERSQIHILDLSKTVPLLHQALVQVRDVVSKGGRVLFVGTKRQASEPIAEAAQRCAQYYMNHRWLGGTLTNWATVSNSIKRLKELDSMFAEGESEGLTKKELLKLQRERDKLDRALGGIANMGGLPSLLFVIDTNKEAIAVLEAKKLGIPVVAVIDTNCDPDSIDYPFPGNDDAARAISLYCNLIADAVMDGLEESAAGMDIDIGAMDDIGDIADADVAVADAAVVEAAVADTETKVEDIAEATEVKADATAPEDVKAADTAVADTGTKVEDIAKANEVKADATAPEDVKAADAAEKPEDAKSDT